LVDACLLYDCDGIGEGVVIDYAWVHSITVTEVGSVLGVSCKASNNTVYIFDELLFISFGSERNATIKFISETSGLSISGSVIVGDPTAVKGLPNYRDMDEDCGLFSPAVLHDISGLYVTAIKIGDSYLSGEVELVAGDGIEFAIESTSTSSHKLTISNTRYTLDADNTKITDDELLEAAIEDFGKPILTINGIAPDAKGNISIVSPEPGSTVFTAPASGGSTEPESGVCTKVEAGDDFIIVGNVGAGTITLELKKDPCVEDDTIDELTANVSELNARCARINSSQLTLDNAVNNIATQLTRLS
jgi:hypothetical protein